MHSVHQALCGDRQMMGRSVTMRFTAESVAMRFTEEFMPAPTPTITCGECTQHTPLRTYDGKQLLVSLQPAQTKITL
jgi:hypothetical protein